jgi:hypothetical protein
MFWSDLAQGGRKGRSERSERRVWGKCILLGGRWARAVKSAVVIRRYYGS